MIDYKTEVDLMLRLYKYKVLPKNVGTWHNFTEARALSICPPAVTLILPAMISQIRSSILYYLSSCKEFIEKELYELKCDGTIDTVELRNGYVDYSIEMTEVDSIRVGAYIVIKASPAANRIQVILFD